MSGKVFAESAIESLERAGVRDWCVCAGARNAELVRALQRRGHEHVHFGFDERSAGFFALGLSRRTNRPVAVVTTSGTAVAELLPAIVEAYYAQIPLVAVTADRPRVYAGSGAPQAIEQPGIFGTYAEALDAECVEDIPVEPRISGPTHWNLRFADPMRESGLLRAQPTTLIEPTAALARFFRESTRPVALVGPLRPHEREPVRQLLISLAIPVCLEATSGLRGDPALARWELPADERWIGARCDGLLRLGAVPTASVWRDVDADPARPMLSLSELPWSGTVRGNHATIRFRDWAALPSRSRWSDAGMEDLQAQAARHWAAKEALYAEFPRSEAALVRRLSDLVPASAALYLGNSLPIRQWDAYAARTPWADVAANRGANGIDGQLSTFLGWAQGTQEAWALVGDLTALYDLSSLWYTSPSGRLRLVVLNNGGGGIFRSLFPQPELRASHTLHFEGWAQLWGWEYRRYETLPDSAGTERCALWELIPCGTQTADFCERERSLL